MKEKFARIVMLVMVLALLASCASQPTPAPQAEQPAAGQSATEAPAAEQPAAGEKILKVGIVGPFTGPNARVGEELKDIHIFLFDKINWKIGDYKIEPVYIDDESDPEKAVRAYKDAILREKIQVGLSGYHSSVTIALMDVTSENKIPYLFPQNESSVIVEKYRSDPVKYAYHQWKGRPSPVKLIVGYEQGLFGDAIENGQWAPANKKFAVLGEDSDFGRDFAAGFIKMAEGLGWELVSEDYAANDTSDFYPTLTKIKAQDPALLFMVMGVPAVATAAIKQTQEVGIKSLVISHGLGWIGEWYQMTGESGDYILDLMQKYSTPEQKAYREEFKAKFNIDPSASLAVSYDYGNFFIKICERALELYGELNSETIFKVANDEVSTGKLTYTDGIWYDELKWSPETLPEMVVGEGYYIDPLIQYFGGEGTILWPDNVKEADLKLRP